MGTRSDSALSSVACGATLMGIHGSPWPASSSASISGFRLGRLVQISGGSGIDCSQRHHHQRDAEREPAVQPSAAFAAR